MSIENFPNTLECCTIEDVKRLLEVNKIKFTKQKFPRGLKIHGKSDFTRITFHIYNVEDVAK